MKTLTVCVLFCAMMVLAKVRGNEEPRKEAPIEGGSQLVKRFLTCAGGWSQLNGRHFCYVPTAMTWTRAERNCLSMGANLASVHSRSEYYDVQRLLWIATRGYKETWIGAVDIQGENIWLWSDGRTFHYRHWCRGQPNYWRGHQACVITNYRGGRCWADVGCGNKYPFLCAKKA